MRRASLECSRTLLIWRAHKALVHSGLPTTCQCDEQAGRFRKGQRRGGCSRPRCGICKRHKLLDEPTRRDYQAALAYREWARELGLCVRMPRRPW